MAAAPLPVHCEPLRHTRAAGPAEQPLHAGRARFRSGHYTLRQDRTQTQPLWRLLGLP